jgi:hypothetical protein
MYIGPLCTDSIWPVWSVKMKHRDFTVGASEGDAIPPLANVDFR